MELQQNNKCEIFFENVINVNLNYLYIVISNISINMTYIVKFEKFLIYITQKKNPTTLPLKSKQFSLQPYTLICTQTLHVHDLGRCTILIFYQT